MIMGLLRVLGAAACLGLAGLAGLSGWVGAGWREDVQGQIASLTGYAPALYDQIERARRGEPSAVEDQEEAGLALLTRAPLHVAPLALRGLRALNAGDAEAADEAFSAAFSRNPRNAPARLWLAHRALERADVARAVDLVSGLFAILPEQSGAYVEAMASLAGLPGGLASLEARFGEGDAPPSWAVPVISRINASAGDLDGLVSLNRITPSTQAAFITRIIAERGVAAGFEVWRSFASDGAGGPFSWPYDARFEKKPGPPPFNWQTHSDLVELARGGGLNVSYLGRGRPILIEQTLLLAPGRYMFTTLLSGDANADGGGLSWVISCSESAIDLGRSVMRDLSQASARVEMRFAVPETGCPAQRLALFGEPGEFPTRARATLSSVAITPVAEAN